jgi:hypothetical protein
VDERYLPVGIPGWAQSSRGPASQLVIEAPMDLLTDSGGRFRARHPILEVQWLILDRIGLDHCPASSIMWVISAAVSVRLWAGVTQPFQTIGFLGDLGRRVGDHVDDGNALAVLGDTHHFAYHSCWIADLVQRERQTTRSKCASTHGRSVASPCKSERLGRWAASASRLACCSISGTRSRPWT